MELLFLNTKENLKVIFNPDLRQIEAYDNGELVHQRYISFNTTDDELINIASVIYKKLKEKKYDFKNVDI